VREVGREAPASAPPRDWTAHVQTATVSSRRFAGASASRPTSRCHIARWCPWAWRSRCARPPVWSAGFAGRDTSVARATERPALGPPRPAL